MAEDPIDAPTVRPAAAGGGNDAAAERLRARIAWYYYVAGMTQQAISERVGITRARVNRLLSSARADGTVRVDIHSPFVRAAALEAALIERYGLKAAVVVPEPDDAAALQLTIGQAAADYLATLLRPRMTVGVGWGRTLRHCANALPPAGVPGTTVVSLMGGLTRGSSNNTFELATRFAEAFGAESLHLAAPIFAADAAMRDLLLASEPLAEVHARARAADVALVAVGNLSEKSLMCHVEAVAEALDDLRVLGAVGDILGHFLDADGRLIDHPLKDRVVSVRPIDLGGVGHVICASGGEHKVPILRAVLSAGYLDTLVTDEGTAAKLLEQGK